MIAQIPYILAVIVFLLKDTFSSITKSREGKTILILIVGYLGYSYFKEKERTEKILQDLPNSELGQLATKLNNSLHRFFKIKVPGIGYLPFDGVDKTKALEVAQRLGELKKYVEFAQAYKALYDVELNDDLEVNDILLDFQKTYNDAFNGKTPIINKTISDKVTEVSIFSDANNPKAGQQKKNSSGLVLEVGKKYTVKSGVNLRRTEKPHDPVDITEPGEVYYINRFLGLFKIKEKTYEVSEVTHMALGYIPAFKYLLINDAFIKEA